MTLNFYRGKARDVLDGYATADWDQAAREGLLEELVGCFDAPTFGWADMLDLLRTTYPDWMIPQYTDEDYGNGPQVVSLLRLVTDLRQRLGQLERLCDNGPWTLDRAGRRVVTINDVQKILRGEARA